jgi:hypothetical protein
MVYFLRGSESENSPEDLAKWIAHRARNGVFDIFYVPIDLDNLDDEKADLAGTRLAEFIEVISTYSGYLDNPELPPYSNDFRILDTALSDAGFVFSSMLEKAIERTRRNGQRARIRVLLANPNSEFARARNEVLNTPPLSRLVRGLDSICQALYAAKPRLSKNPANITDIDHITYPEKVSRLMGRINSSCQDSDSIACEIKLYDGPLYGPLYFFQNILLQGKYSSAQSGSANAMPWFVLVNNPGVSNDMYDVWAYEFEKLWNDPFRSTSSYDSSIVQNNIYVVHNLDDQFEERFDRSLNASFGSQQPIKAYYSKFSNRQRFPSFKALDASIKFAKIIVYLLDESPSFTPFEVTSGALSDKYIAVVKDEAMMTSSNEFIRILRHGEHSHSIHTYNQLDSLFEVIADLLNLTKEQINTTQLSSYFIQEHP